MQARLASIKVVVCVAAFAVAGAISALGPALGIMDAGAARPPDPGVQMVSVENTPTVRIDPTANTVAVTNSPENPLHVSGGDSRTPVLFRLGGTIVPYQTTYFDYEVPAGDEWLVIKTLGWWDKNYSGGSQVLQVLDPGGVEIGTFSSDRYTKPNGEYILGGTHACEIAVPPGSTLRYANGGYQVNDEYLTISGYTTRTP